LYPAVPARTDVSSQEALLQRSQLLEDSQTAAKSAITKRRNVERLKGSSNISAVKVSEAIGDMEEVHPPLPEYTGELTFLQADALETSLSSRLNAISQNLHTSLRTHSKNAHEDITVALLEHARFTVGFQRMYLKELEALRPDVNRIGTDSPVVPVKSPPTGTTTPSYTMPPHAQPVRNYSSPPTPAPPMDGTKSMFLPPQGNRQPLVDATPDRLSTDVRPNPLGGGMAQSMMLPNQGQGGQQRPSTVGRAGARRLDERQVAKLLAGGF
jgi:hypothetical protein